MSFNNFVLNWLYFRRMNFGLWSFFSQMEIMLFLWFYFGLLGNKSFDLLKILREFLVNHFDRCLLCINNHSKKLYYLIRIIWSFLELILLSLWNISHFIIISQLCLFIPLYSRNISYSNTLKIKYSYNLYRSLLLCSRKMSNNHSLLFDRWQIAFLKSTSFI